MHRFSFNLLPEKPAEEVEKEEKRETTALSLAILPLITVIISIILIVVNNLVLSSVISSWEEAISKRNAQIRSYASVITLNIEFATKTQLLAEPVSDDISPERFFELSDSILSSLSFKTEIKKYGRNLDGSFDVVLTINDIKNAADILKAFEENSQISYANMKGINLDQDAGTVDTTISFIIKES